MSQAHGSEPALAPRLAAICAACSGRVGFAARDLRTGRTLEWDADALFPTASLIKLAILVEVERQALAGLLSFDTSVVLPDAAKVAGSGVLQHLQAGLTLRVRDLAHLMMAISDNTATNLLIDLVGLEQVNETMRREGFGDIELCHKIDFGRLWQHSDDLGVGTPRAFTGLMTRILEHTILTPAGCEAALRLMDRVGAEDRLGRYLPFNLHAAQHRAWGVPATETGPLVRFAGKTGTLRGVRTHAAAVWSDEAPLRYVLTAMVAGSTDRTTSVDDDGTLTIARLGQLAHEAFAQGR